MHGIRLHSVLDSLRSHIALVDHQGTLLYVNAPWLAYAAENGGSRSDVDVGANYLDVCRRAIRAADPYAEEALAGIEDVIRGRPVFTLEYPCHSPNNRRWFMMKVTRLAEDDAIVIAHDDITSLKEAEDALLQSEHRLRQAVDFNALAFAAAKLGLWRLDLARNRLYCSDELLDVLGVARSDWGATREAFEAMVHPADIGSLRIARNAAVEHGDFIEHDFRIRSRDGQIRWLYARGKVRRDEAGKPIETYGVMMDITDRKRAETQMQLLVQELNHRARNLLALVQAFARLTARDVSPARFLDAFGQRIAGLAATHDLLARAGWQGTDVRDLVVSQLGELQRFVGTRIICNGPQVRLKPVAAQAIGMALRELATYAGRHGALSGPEGSVRISWATYADRLELTWAETGGPAPGLKERDGFDHRILVDSVEASLNADAELGSSRSGITWRAVAPLEDVVEAG